MFFLAPAISWAHRLQEEWSTQRSRPDVWHCLEHFWLWSWRGMLLASSGSRTRINILQCWGRPATQEGLWTKMLVLRGWETVPCKPCPPVHNSTGQRVTAAGHGSTAAGAAALGGAGCPSKRETGRILRTQRDVQRACRLCTRSSKRCCACSADRPRCEGRPRELCRSRLPQKTGLTAQTGRGRQAFAPFGFLFMS